MVVAAGSANVVIAEEYNVYDAPPTPPRPGSPPPIPGIFIGRDKGLRDLKTCLGIAVEDQAAVPPQPFTVVTGVAGVGKTTMAAALANEPDILGRYPDGVLWTSIGEKPSLISVMATWGRALGTDELLRVPTLPEAINQLRGLLLKKRLLLIVDDVWETQHAEPFRQSRGRDCALIFTTRLPSVADSLATLAPTPTQTIYHLPVLTEENALRLLRALAPTVVVEYPQESRELVRDLECLPLALQVAGHMLNVEAKRGFDVKDLLAELRSGKKLLEAKAPADRIDLENQTIPTVAALLRKSTDRLDSHTRDCFAYLGAFAPKPADFDLAALKRVWEVSDPRPIANELLDRGLLEPVGSGRFRMHALLVAHARSLATP